MSEKCQKCGMVYESSIHDYSSPNAEIRLASHRFISMTKDQQRIKTLESALRAIAELRNQVTAAKIAQEALNEKA